MYIFSGEYFRQLKFKMISILLILVFYLYVHKKNAVLWKHEMLYLRTGEPVDLSTSHRLYSILYHQLYSILKYSTFRL